MQLTPSHLRMLANRCGYQGWSSVAVVGTDFPIVVETKPENITYVFTEAQLTEFAKEVVAVERRPNPAHGAPMPAGYRPVA